MNEPANTSMRDKRIWALLAAAVILGIVSSFVFLRPNLNVKPLWMLNGPPVILMHLVGGPLGILSSSIPRWIFSSFAYFIGIVYYVGLISPVLHAGFTGNAPIKDSLRQSQGLMRIQIGLLAVHALLAGVVFMLNAAE